MNYQQTNLINQLELYFKNQDPPADLPFDSWNGLCSGLVAYWLYSKRIGEEGRFLHKLEYVLTHNDPKDRKIAEFVNNVMFLHHDKRLRDCENINQDSLAESFKLLLGKYQEQVNPAEFKLTFVFNHKTLSHLLRYYVLPNKMVRLDNGFHTMGLMYRDGTYYLYNPDSSSGPQSFIDPNQLAAEIFAGLGKYCGSKEYIAISMSVFDIDDAEPGAYVDQNAIAYCKKLLKDEEYKQAVLTHKNIFHLGCRYDAYDMLDYLFNIGYKYIPWNINPTTEYEEAVIYQHKAKLQFLLAHKIPIDYRTDAGTTALARAIIKNAPEMMYILLSNGADPNVPANNTKSLLDVALLYDNCAAIILLFAFGMELSEKNLKKIKEKYTFEQIQEIEKHALKLQAKLGLQHDENVYLPKEQIAKQQNIPLRSTIIFSHVRSYAEDVAPLLSINLKI